MCGIFSIINNVYNFSTVSSSFMKGVGRGPEYSCIEPYDKTSPGQHILMGFHRLAINGYLDESSNQPFNIDNITLICNGEIYNWNELYSIIGDDCRKSNSDCEVIIHLYNKYGIKQTLQMLDGVFAFVLLDRTKGKIYVARDTYGVRPLYIGMRDNRSHTSFILTSEMKMLHNFNIKLKQFTPGTYSEFSSDHNDKSYYVYGATQKWTLTLNNERFSQCDSFTNITINTEEKACKLIRNSLMEAVKKRVNNTERDIACLLSGGLDSSLIAGLVSRELASKNQKLKTWSIGLEGSEDVAYAQKVADHIGSDHTAIILSEDEFLNSIEDVIYAIESYDTTTVRASVGNWLISKYIKKKSECKVIFNGDGSDELTGGYMYFHCAPDEIAFDGECRRLLGDIHYFDVLRSDRSISSHGLEARTPFLDRNFIQSYLSIPLKYRCHNLNNQCEKYLLRKSFEEMNVIPGEVLWRKKEAFSDGVSKQTKSWFEIIQDHVKDNVFKVNKLRAKDIIDKYVNMFKLTHNTPKTLEQLYYRIKFEDKFKNQAETIPYFWMPKFVKATDASARTLDIYNKIGGKNKKNQYVKRVREINNFENKKISGSVFNNLKNRIYNSGRNSSGIVPRNNGRYNLRTNIKTSNSMSKYYN